ncbi:hypothetical protein PG994_002739 [Apiospora phragmitis]|uniref:Uncharacterized protein n=1 Tax=Apiospora phragmitis TaxID=2905665 RepID=A0ABR1W5Z9_9PEZI
MRVVVSNCVAATASSSPLQPDPTGSWASTPTQPSPCASPPLAATPTPDAVPHVREPEPPEPRARQRPEAGVAQRQRQNGHGEDQHRAGVPFPFPQVDDGCSIATAAKRRRYSAAAVMNNNNGALVLEDIRVIRVRGRDLAAVDVAVLRAARARGQDGAEQQANDQEVGVQGALRDQQERLPVEVLRQGGEPEEGEGDG